MQGKLRQYVLDILSQNSENFLVIRKQMYVLRNGDTWQLLISFMLSSAHVTKLSIPKLHSFNYVQWFNENFAVFYVLHQR